MNDITELVDLPDPAVQPLVHPLDLPEARRPFRISWLIATLTSLPVGLLVAGIVWFVSRNYVVPLITGAVVIGFGSLASGFFRAQAWTFIPRKRQDRARPLPARWELGSAVAFSALLAVALLLVVFRLDRPDVSVAVREFTFGAAAATGLLVALDFVGKLLRHRGAERKRALATLPGVVVVMGGIAVAYNTLFDASDAGASTNTYLGAATMLLVGAAAGIWQYAARRRRTVTRDRVA